MKKVFALLFLVFLTKFGHAQFVKEKSINAMVGWGYSSPLNSVDDVLNTGFFAQGELVLRTSSWVELIPYAGMVITNSDGTDIDGNPTNELGETKAFLLGTKARLRAPIPWVAPYIELGIGASIGSFETMTAFDSISKRGIVYHIPISLGLELGRNNNFDLGFMYYWQPSVEQFSGAFAIGLTFPLKN